MYGSIFVCTCVMNMWHGQFEDMICSLRPALSMYLCAGGARADPNRLQGQKKYPQMGCLGLRQERDAALAEADRRTE